MLQRKLALGAPFCRAVDDRRAAAQFQASVSLAIGLGRDVGLTVVNFFSFFTVLSNLGAALVLASIAWTSVQRPGTLTRTAGLALACVTTAMLVCAGRWRSTLSPAGRPGTRTRS